MIFYAKGYRYNFEEKEVHKVGMIMVAFDPLGADATVNGEGARFDLTALGYNRFTDLEEGKYNVEVREKGYHNWYKKLNVKPEVVTWARYITLFKEDTTPRNILSLPSINATDVAPNKEWICIAGQEKKEAVLHISKMNGEESQTIPFASLLPKSQKKATISGVKFAPDSTHILVDYKVNEKTTQHLIFSRELGQEDPPFILENAVKNNIDEIKWHPDTGSTLYYTSANDLYRIAISPQIRTKKLASNVLGFQPDKSYLYFVRPRDEQIRKEPQASLKKMNLDGSEPEIISEDIELDTKFSINISTDDKIAIRTQQGALYIIHKPEENNDINYDVERIATGIAQMHWGKDTDEEEDTDEMLLYANNKEIFVYDSEISNTESVITLPRDIQNLDWFPLNYKYIMYSTDKQLSIIELDERDQRNIANIWSATDKETILPGTLFVDKDNEHLLLEIADQNKTYIRDLTIR